MRLDVFVCFQNWKSVFCIDISHSFSHLPFVTIARQFHDWDISSLPAALDLLLEGWAGNNPLDLRDILIVVPTRHAGRRLRAELARITSEKGSAVLAGAIVTPEHLVPPPSGVADDSLVLALLARRVFDQHTKLTALFPATETQWSFAFALGIAGQIQDLRRQLNEAGLSAGEMIPKVPEDERERWEEIGQLEHDLLQEIAKHGLKDPLQARRETAEHPPKPVTYSQVISLFIPDLSPLAIRMLTGLSETCAVVLHVLAPESEQHRFDEWGRPLPDEWENEPLPVAESQIHVFEQAPEETNTLVDLLLKAKEKSSTLAICAPDPANAQALARRLQMDKCPLYLPNGVPLTSTAPGKLLSAWLNLLQRRDYASTAAFLRHPDAQKWIAKTLSLADVKKILIELDKCHKDHLPATFNDLQHFAHRKSSASPLARTVALIERHFDAAPADFLANLYNSQEGLSEDPLFTVAAQGIASLITSATEAARLAKLDNNATRDLLLACLSREQVFPKPNSSIALETIGWLEAQWEPAPALLLADVREGIVPETRIGDAFLPDSIRVVASIPGNRETFARDLYLTRALLASRTPEGIRFFYSRRAANQDPQLPSRLLLACPREQLPARVGYLFERPAIGAKASTSPPLPRLMLSPPPIKAEEALSYLRVTMFKSYLGCPFRFYLKHVLKMEPADDGARELNAGLFGTLAHAVLSILQDHSDLADENKIAALLDQKLDELIQEQVGENPPLAVLVQISSLRQRLRAVAGIQATSVREGWRIIETEATFSTQLDDMEIHATIDRIERHTDGRIRILDYKTSDGGDNPLKAHYRPQSEEHWKDLQLPLYRFIYEKAHPEVAPVSAGYFNLPKAATDTGIAMMNFQHKNGDLFEDAISRAKQVAADIQAGIFWPPSEKTIRYDDFELLFARGSTLIRELGRP